MSLFAINAYPYTQLDSLPTTAWEQYYGDLDIVCQNRFASLTPQSKELVVAGDSEMVNKDISQNEGIFIWKINSKGEKISDLNLKDGKIGNRSYVLERIQALFADSDDTVMIIAKTNSTASLLIKANYAGKTIFARLIDSNINITKIIPVDDNCYIMIGERNGYPFVSKINSMGNELWNKSSNRNKYGSFVDGISTNDGCFILVENSGASSKIMKDTTAINVTKYDSNGVKQNEKSIAGRYGMVASGSNAVFAILYDKSNTYAQDIWVQAYDKDLTPVWGCNVASAILGADGFSIAAFASGDYLVAGTSPDTFKTLVVYIDSSGVKKWEYLSKTADYALGVGVTCADGGCYLIKSVTTSTTDDSEVKKVKVIKFSPW